MRTQCNLSIKQAQLRSVEPAEIRVGLQVGEDRHGRVFAYDKVILVSARLGDKVKQSVADSCCHPNTCTPQSQRHCVHAEQLARLAHLTNLAHLAHLYFTMDSDL
ncbi:hypothetical protein VTP01DRAFT_9638 [Rhizomucor pusillus]|uniref:uncharacterized protein n=1 Tax=Rhizomucor pusillus TaxID=4840 RepID=UPI00374368A4